MRVLFLYCSTPIDIFGPQYSQGIGYLAAVLKEKAHKAECLLVASFNKNEISKKIESFNPNLIAISLTTDQFNLAKKVSEFIHKKYNIPTVLGGAHPTVSPYDSLAIEGVLGICRSEGEFALLELVEALEKNTNYTDIKNFYFNSEGKIIENQVRPRLQDLSLLPFPDRETQQAFVDYKNAEFMASRGCPFGCAYCINGFLRNFYGKSGCAVIYRSVDNVLREISQVVKKYNSNFLIFHDDTFTMNTPWLRQFCEEYPRHFNIPVQVNGHPHTITKEVVELLKKANVCEVKLGVEAGSEKLRKEILKRNVSDADIINAANMLHEAGIKVGSFNMIGIPNETAQDIEKTIELNKKIMPIASFGLSIFKPYPGTELYGYCTEHNLLSERQTSSFFNERSILNQTSISQRTLSYYWRVFKPSVYGVKTLPLIKFAARHLFIAICYEQLLKIIKIIIPKGARAFIRENLIKLKLRSR